MSDMTLEQPAEASTNGHAEHPVNDDVDQRGSDLPTRKRNRTTKPPAPVKRAPRAGIEVQRDQYDAAKAFIDRRYGHTHTDMVVGLSLVLRYGLHLREQAGGKPVPALVEGFEPGDHEDKEFRQVQIEQDLRDQINDVARADFWGMNGAARITGNLLLRLAVQHLDEVPELDDPFIDAAAATKAREG